MSQTITRIGQVLDLFSPVRASICAADVARHTGLSRASSHELLASLAEVGILITHTRGQYYLGKAVTSLNETLRSSQLIDRVAYATLNNLSGDTGETAELVTVDRSRAMCIDAVNNKSAVTINTLAPGSFRPLHCSATGKIILANDSRLWRLRYRARQLTPYTKATVTDWDDLASQINRVRDSGVAYDFGESIDQLSCIARAVHDGSGTFYAALGIVVPQYRLTRSQARLEECLLRAADELSERLVQYGRPGSVPA